MNKRKLDNDADSASVDQTPKKVKDEKDTTPTTASRASASGASSAVATAAGPSSSSINNNTMMPLDPRHTCFDANPVYKLGDPIPGFETFEKIMEAKLQIKGDKTLMQAFNTAFLSFTGYNDFPSERLKYGGSIDFFNNAFIDKELLELGPKSPLYRFVVNCLWYVLEKKRVHENETEIRWTFNEILAVPGLHIPAADTRFTKKFAGSIMIPNLARWISHHMNLAVADPSIMFDVDSPLRIRWLYPAGCAFKSLEFTLSIHEGKSDTPVKKIKEEDIRTMVRCHRDQVTLAGMQWMPIPQLWHLAYSYFEIPEFLMPK